ncbi:UDP-N-acetylglucosamine 4,6-dehydratase (inverting) [Methanospirillum stamsii]|uniref:UDP-N-acetylglucosamine 4,6-dehydratase (Inverting) n=1 Tax=Methanospirillum stamsii TaxID=1277351 RepID=A0A2V2MZ40_9EURY|nr:UDP-N-acetylglucosamine 4,6-dehydratase (inverting) [Methanospirillum stamsii]PWR69598.1 UDP-N-acetylglucosamine 4,6-dehydratase (inverting) [Methanospirillum stamsii]
MSFFDNKTILITGGTGSFGNAFTSRLLNNHNPHSIRIYSRGEYLQWKMQQKFSDNRLRFFIGDVRDKNRLNRALNDVDIVVHAAALKQVPACEYNPIEAVRTNIDGTTNLIDASIDNSVERLMALSTDKAVHPVNLYGATKMVAEKLFIQGNAYSGKNSTRFSCVRYGNVVGSRGSIVPLFDKQKEEGKISITDPRMTRFWLTLDQGAVFVDSCTRIMKGGEIFVPKIASMKITDLAEAMAPGIPHEYIGIRPGEKIHEVLITEDEARHTRDLKGYYIIDPEISFWNGHKKDHTYTLPEGFRYSSETNTEWLDEEGLRQMLAESHP